jgi:hypothetical protein
MTQRINISISDELHELIQNAKNSIKVSKICQEAIMNALKELHMDPTHGIDELVNRLKKDFLKIYKPFRDIGKIDGIKDAYLVSSENFQTYLYWKKAFIEQKSLDYIEFMNKYPEVGHMSEDELIHETMSLIGSEDSNSKAERLYIGAPAKDDHDEDDERERQYNAFYQLVQNSNYDNLIISDLPINQEAFNDLGLNPRVSGDEYMAGWFEGLESVFNEVYSRLIKAI